MIVGGGGSMNPTLLAHIADCLPGCEVMTNEQLGLDSNAKEAVAFAVLANEAMYGQPNNAPGATGAAHPVVMGKSANNRKGGPSMTSIEIRVRDLYDDLNDSEKRQRPSF